MQELNRSYTDGSGSVTTVVRPSGSLTDKTCRGNFPPGVANPVGGFRACGLVESPTLFRHDNRYYLSFSDPICAYCLGTGTSYFEAQTPLGRWHGTNNTPSYDPAHASTFDPYPLSADSCGGQPSHVAPLPGPGRGLVDLYTSNLWNGEANEGASNHYWAPLRFDPDGQLAPVRCRSSVEVPIVNHVFARPMAAAPLDLCVVKHVALEQTFTATARGRLHRLELPLYQQTEPASLIPGKEGYPSAPLQITVRGRTGVRYHAVLRLALSRAAWTPTQVSFKLDLPAAAGQQFHLTLRTDTPTGCYGTLYDVHDRYRDGRLRVSGRQRQFVTRGSHLKFLVTETTGYGPTTFGNK